MIDYFSIALTHGLIALAVFRLLFRDDLDREGNSRFSRRKSGARAVEKPPAGEAGDA